MKQELDQKRQIVQVDTMSSGRDRALFRSLKAYVPVCDGIALLLHPHAEVVLHNLASNTIAYITNAFSQRRAGDSSLIQDDPDISLSNDVIGPYTKTNPDGRRLKSVTVVLRAEEHEPFGLLCINQDIEAFHALSDYCEALILPPQPSAPPATLFAGDWREAVNTVVGSFLAVRRTSIAGLTANDIYELLLALEAKGIFSIRNAVPYVAEVLGCSRTTLYNRLKSARRRSSNQA